MCTDDTGVTMRTANTSAAVKPGGETGALHPPRPSRPSLHFETTAGIWGKPRVMMPREGRE